MTTRIGTGGDPAPSPGLRERVVAASVAARPAGRPADPPPEVSPVTGLTRAADALDALLRSLTPDEWRRPALRGLDVQGLVGHLVGVEEDLHRCLTAAPGTPVAAADADHVAHTDPAAHRQRGRDPGLTRAEWRAAIEGTLRHVAALDPARLAEPVVVHRVRLPLRDLLVARVFELWTHENDIRRAVGRAATAPDDATLALMTRLAVRLLPAGVRRTGSDLGARRVRLVLTGGGGGTWDLPPRADGDAATAARIVTDAVSFCRLAANRVPRDRLAAQVSGDAALADAVLAGAAALALD